MGVRKLPMPSPLSPKHAANAVEAIEAHIASVTRQRDELTIKIEGLQESLRALQRQCGANGGSSSPASGATRRKKGENLRRLLEFFESHRDAGFTVSQLSSELAVSPSSLQNVLRKSPLFFQGGDGLWRTAEPGERLI